MNKMTRAEESALAEQFAEDMLAILCDNSDKLKGPDAEKTLYLILKRAMQLTRDMGEM